MTNTIPKNFIEKYKTPLAVVLACIPLALAIGYDKSKEPIRIQEAKQFEIQQKVNELELKILEDKLNEEKAEINQQIYERIHNSYQLPIKVQPKKEEIKSKKTEPSHPVTPEFVAKLIKQESGNNPNAVSHKGARGLMQIMKPTWNEMTQKLYGEKLPYEQAFNPVKNKHVGTNYLFELDELLTNSLPHYEKSTIREQQRYIAAAYNGGPTKLIQRKGRINTMPKETQKYVQIVCRH